MSRDVCVRSPRREGRRTWRIPPAIQLEPDEILPGSFVLAEVSGAEGLLLWQLLRDVSLWATVPAAIREGLFTVEAPRARAALLSSASSETGSAVFVDSLVSLLRAPGSFDAGMVSQLCLRVAMEAVNQGPPHTGVAFAQAAAIADPTDADACVEVGRIARQMNHLARAESWLERAVGIARRTQAWESYVRATLELALVAERGRLWGLAHKRFIVALRVSRRHGFRDLMVEARHGLVRVLTGFGHFPEAMQQARRALRWDRLVAREAETGGGTPRGVVPAAESETITDLRLYIVTLQCRMEDLESAWRELQAVQKRDLTEGQRLVATALLAYLGAARNNHAVVAQAWHELWPYLQDAAPSDYRNRAAVELTRAMALTRDVRRFQDAADLAESFRQQVEPLPRAQLSGGMHPRISRRKLPG